MFPFDSTIVLLIPPLLFAFWAQWKVKSSFKKYSRIKSTSGYSGKQVAREILDMYGLNDVKIQAVSGTLSDHYDPRNQTVNLSESVYNSRSIAALGIAAHEVVHAIQHAKGYSPLVLRHTLLMPANLGSTLAFPLFFIGFIFQSISILMTIGIIFFTAALAFQLITLPVEFNASRRALTNLRRTGLMADEEVNSAQNVLNAAAWTYVAAATMALTQLIRLLILRDARE